MEVLTLGMNDYGKPWGFTIKDSDGNAEDITDYTITLKVWVPKTPGTLILEETCVKDVPASGTCHYTPQLGDFPSERIYMAELEKTKSGVRDSSGRFKIKVTESG